MVQDWPALPYSQWKDTYATLHMWTQVVGKIKLKHTPRTNHWWNVAFLVSPRGLYSGAMTYRGQAFAIEFNFIEHQLEIFRADGARRQVKLEPKSVAQFYMETLDALHSLGIKAQIWPVPVEVPEPMPFRQDTVHATYEPAAAERAWRVLLSATSVLEEFRSGYIGKCSPVHFFWGSFDLAVTRFNGETAPEREGADSITREAYSHSVISHGFWPGNADIDAAFYAYATPEPDGFNTAAPMRKDAFYHSELGEYFLPYAALRSARDPRAELLAFCSDTYNAAADLADWDRMALERH